jgi:hypothetical protein
VVGFALRRTPSIDAHLEHVCVIKMKARRSEVDADFLKCGGDVFTTRVLLSLDIGPETGGTDVLWLSSVPSRARPLSDCFRFITR